ncbi:MAG: PIN domain-containing protein [Acidobacteria bacterium]|nr:PIN domain-containing protein [Acidobacteriota bacterium]
MNFLVDTSVWSLALRRSEPGAEREVARLREALFARESIYTTGLILQELLQGFRGPRQRAAILRRFSALPAIAPDRNDHIEAAEVRNRCRRNGVQLGTIDALLAQLAIRHELVLLTTDQDFIHAAAHVPLKVWRS